MEQLQFLGLTLELEPQLVCLVAQLRFLCLANLDFVTNAGYLPVTTGAFDALFSDFSLIEKESYRSVYQAVGAMQEDYSFYALALYDGASDIQLGFEKNVKTVLAAAHNQYAKRVGSGEDPAEVLHELVNTSLAELKRLSGE